MAKRGILLTAKQSQFGPIFNEEPDVFFDCIVQETPEFNATPTDNTLENGDQISDHVLIAPDRLTLEIVVTNTPVDLLAIPQSVFTGLVGEDRVKAVQEQLEKMIKAGKPIDVITDFKIYRTMIATSFTQNRNFQNGSSIIGTMTFQQIKIVSSESIILPPKKTVPSAATKQDIGKQATTPATVPVQEQAESILFKVQQGGLKVIDNAEQFGIGLSGG